MKRRVFFVWLASYSLILLIPITGIFIAFSQSNRVIEEEISNGHRASLKQIKHIIDGELENVDRLIMEISWNPIIENLKNRELPLTKRDRFNIYQFHQTARIYAAVNGMVEDFFIYLPNTDIVITPSSMFSSLDEYGEIFFNFSEPDEWKKIMDTNYAGGFQILEENSDPATDYYWIHSLPVGGKSVVRAQTGMRLNRDMIETILSKNRWIPQARLGIIDITGHVLFEYPSLPDEWNDWPAIEEGNFLVDVNGETCMLSLIRGSKPSWYYYSLIPRDLFLESAYAVRLTLIIVIGITYLLAFLLLFLMTERNYKPIGFIVSSLDNRVDDDRDELEMIRCSMNQLLAEQEISSRTEFLSLLVDGMITEGGTLEEGMEKYRLDWEGKYFQIVRIYVESLGDRSEFLTKDELLSILSNAFGHVEHYIIEKRGILTLLLIYPCTNYRTTAEKGASLAVKELEQFELAAALSFSGLTESPLLLYLAREEAGEALEAELFRGNRRILFYEDMRSRKKPSYLSSLELENAFLNAMRINSFDIAKKVVLDELERLSKRECDYWQLKTRAMGIISLVIDAFGELKGAYWGDYSEEFRALTGSDNLEDIGLRIVFLLDSLKKDVEQKSVSLRDTLAAQSDRYIEKQYTDINLTVASIADFIGVSDSYLSSQYKKEKGYGLLKGIHRKRIREGKKMLRSTDLTLGEISSKIGYASDIAFIRTFKRYEGISPGKYRDSVKKS